MVLIVGFVGGVNRRSCNGKKRPCYVRCIKLLMLSIYTIYMPNNVYHYEYEF